MSRAFLLLTTVLALSACDKGTPSEAQAAPSPPTTSADQAATSVMGPGNRVPAVPADEMGTAADISQFHALPALDAKIFSLSGGDPAVNGLVTYFALFGGAAEGWRTYPLGDYAEWRVVEAKAGRVFWRCGRTRRVRPAIF